MERHIRRLADGTLVNHTVSVSVTEPVRHIRKPDISKLLVEVPTAIDYFGLQIPTYETAFSRYPRYKDNANDPYICTARFKDEYIKTLKETGQISRSMDNMLPTFFVYEADGVPLEEQIVKCKEVSEDEVHKDWIFSQTYSGSKSIHTLVWIHPSLRNEVIRDFKFYWLKMAEVIFGVDYTKRLDSACASIARLSRNPNGIRENGKKQTCIFYNPNAVNSIIPISSWKEELDKKIKETERKQSELYQSLMVEHHASDDMTSLERLYKSPKHSPLIDLAYDVMFNNICPSGANYVGAAASLKGCGLSIDFIRKMLQKASIAHPTNISKHNIDTILRRLFTR